MKSLLHCLSLMIRNNLNSFMTEDITIQRQIEILHDLTKINTEEKISLYDFSLLIFIFPFQCLTKDWHNSSIWEKIVFIIVISPLLWLISAFLMKI